MKRVFWFVATVALSSCAYGVDLGDDDNAGADADADSATLRRDAVENWYNEAAGDPTARTGMWTAEYRRFMLTAAAGEKARWGELVTKADGTTSGPHWVNLGPTRADSTQNGSSILHVTDSGRLRSIVVDPADPRRLFIATAGGGVWRSTDAGANWKALTDSLGSLACGALALDPTDLDTLYLGLGDPFDGTGIGLVKTTDGGETWSDPVYLGDSTVTTQVVVAPSEPNVVIATTNHGIFRSTDAGANWGLVSLDTGHPTSTPYAWSITQTGRTSFAASLVAAPEVQKTGTTDGQVWVTADDGATWSKATGLSATAGVGRITVAASPSEPNVVWAVAAVPFPSSNADLADIFKSTDGGAHWTARNVAKKKFKNGGHEAVNTVFNGQAWYDQLVLVDPSDSNTVYFGGAEYLGKTDDGGSTFHEVTSWLALHKLPYVHSDFHAGAFDGAGGMYVGTDGGLFYSADTGKTWTDALNVGITTHLIYSVSSSTQDRNAVVGGFQDNGTRVRAGATSTFNQYIGGDGIGTAMSANDAKVVLGSLYYDRIYKSADGGLTYKDASTGIAEANDSTNAPFLTRILRWGGSPAGQDVVYTFSNIKVYVSPDFADHWSALGTTGLPADIYIRNFNVAAASQDHVGIVASGGRVFVSSDGGASWTAGGVPPNNDKSLSWIHFDAADPTVVYLASVAPNAKAAHLWKSTDGGASWTALDGTGLPAGVPVNLIKDDPSRPGVLYAATHLGVYRSDDAGASWARYGAGMPLVNVTDLYIAPDGSLVRAATFGRGFWELVD
jgi:photosystem II stability/assembly factor-like uncharacterized protein